MVVKKVAVKKSVGRPKVAKTVVKKPVGRPKKVTTVEKPVTKRYPGRPKLPVGTAINEMDALTGLQIGSDQWKIAQALLEGGKTRAEIVTSVTKTIGDTTRNGTKKPIANLVSSVYNKLIKAGFILESSFRLTPPTPASKRKATRAANAATK